MTHQRTISLHALFALAIAFAISWLAAAPARADSGVGVVVTGEATMQPQLAAQLETWLRTHGHNLVSAPLPPEAINTLIDCFVIEDQSCARKVVEKRAKAASVVFAQVTVTAGATALDRTVTLTAYWLDKGKDAIAERRSCERCTDGTLRDTADELMVALAGAGSNRGRIKVISTPEGAKVIIGGKSVGTTPLDYSLPLGDHKIVVEAPGRRSETRSVSVKKGRTATVEVALAVKSPRSKLAFVAIGGGGALAVAGGVLFALDEDLAPNDTQTRTYFDSAPGGIVLMATGAVALGAGIYLAVRGGKPGKSAPTVSFVPGGSVIGWAGRF